MRDFDAIVIGSGAGGLTAAVALARAGQRVLVLEQHYVPGGWCHSFTLEGFQFSPGVHYIGELGPGGMMQKIYDGLGLGGDLSFFELNPDGFDHIIAGGQRFDIPKGKGALIERLSQRFPREASGIRQYIDIIDAVAEDLVRAVDVSKPTDLLKLPFSLRNIARHGLGTLEGLMDEHLEDPFLRTIASMQCGDTGLPPSKMPTAMHAAVARHYFRGGFYPKGGAFTIPRAFLRELKRNGGELWLECEVERIKIEEQGGKRRAVGVVLKDGRELSARVVISNADPHVTYKKLVGEAHLSRFLKWRLGRTRYSISALSLFAAVDLDLKARGFDSGNYWFARSPDVESMYKTQRLDQLLSNGPEGFFLTVTTLKDPTKRRDGLHTIESFTFLDGKAFDRWSASKFGERPADYEATKKALIDKMLTEIERLIPDVRRHVVFSDLGTPLSNWHYVRATEGGLYGTEKTLSQIGPFAYQTKSEIDGLMLCGASTLGHGVAGATLSGLQVASRILGTSMMGMLDQNPEKRLALYLADDDRGWPAGLKKKPRSAAAPTEARA